MRERAQETALQPGGEAQGHAEPFADTTAVSSYRGVRPSQRRHPEKADWFARAEYRQHGQQQERRARFRGHGQQRGVHCLLAALQGEINSSSQQLSYSILTRSRSPRPSARVGTAFSHATPAQRRTRATSELFSLFLTRKLVLLLYFTRIIFAFKESLFLTVSRRAFCRAICSRWLTFRSHLRSTFSTHIRPPQTSPPSRFQF